MASKSIRYKCKIIKISRRKVPFTYLYSIGSMPLRIVTVCKFPRIMFDTKIKYHSHYKYMENKTLQILRFGGWQPNFRWPTITIIYLSLVASKILFQTHINEIEAIQHKFFRYMT